MTRRIRLILASFLPAIALFCSISASADTKGAVSGIVTDPSGAVVPNVSVIATATATNVQNTTITDGKGFYNFPTLNVGIYTISIKQAGYSDFEETGVIIDANSSIRIDVALKIGSVTDVVTVKSNTLQVETQSSQMGQVIEAEKITSVPLNGRSFIDLLALQPGVSPYSITAFNTGTGIGGRTVSGSLSNGSQSVNGGRSGSNSYLINGAYAEEGAHQAAAMVPNLDSIAEFRIITNNYNAEYGNYSGGQINVVTKAGTNNIHGNAFEFLRNTDLDAKNYYLPVVSPYKQNQFGGTIGAPIRRDHIFGFADYQGTRQSIASVKTYAVASEAEHAGDFSQLESSLTKTVGGSGGGQTAWAQTLSERLGYTVKQGEPYYVEGCTTTTECVFPNGIIPASAVDPVSKNLIGYVPLPTDTTKNLFSTTAYSTTLADDKGSARVDMNTRLGSLFAYYFRDHFNGVTPFFRHTNVPGFSSGTTGFTQMANLGLTTTINSSTVNDLRLVYLRVSGTLGLPVGGTASGEIAKLGFTTPWGDAGGLSPVVPSYEGVPVVALKSNSANLGTTNSTIREANNTVQFIDNFIKTIGTHSFQAGVNYHYDQINERNTSCPNGCFTFNGNETGVDFADLMIGAPSAFSQAGQTQLNSRSNYFGAYAQDSWRVRPTLTLNLGVRWDISQPWYDTKNMLSTFVPGEQSQVFPNAPTGMVFPGDKGIAKTIAPTRYDNFAPRIGFAYAPAAGNFSIRGGYGIFYSSIQQVSGMNTAGGPPFNVYYGSPVQPNLDSPFTDRFSGNSEGVRFPVPLPPSNVSVAHPDPVDFTQFEQISGSYGIYPTNGLPMLQNYELSVQHSFGSATVFTLSYVGTSGRHQMTSVEANPGNESLCAFLSDPANVAPDTATCGPFGEDQEYVKRDGTLVEGTRSIFNTLALGSNPWMKASAGSSYHSLQSSLEHRDRFENFLIAYTWSKSIDNSSDVFDSTNAYDPRQSRALSYHDVPHHFVASYTVQLPFNKFIGSNLAKPLTAGWAVSGITSFTSGEVIGLSEGDDDNALSGAYNAPFDTPSYANNGSALFQRGVTSKDPRNKAGLPYFNPNYFTTEPIGQIGNAMRRYFHGPGVNNTDLALAKNTQITGAMQIQFRAEAFNVFNHAQFDGADGEIGDVGDTFGFNLSARDPRIMQLALKFVF